MLNPSELRNFTVEELQVKLDDFKKQLMQFRFQHKTGKLERQSTMRETKRDIARILTVVNQKNAEVKP